MVENIPAFVVPQLILSPPAMILRLKGVLVRMIKVPDMRPASAPIPSQPRTAVKLIMPLPAEASARKPMPTTAVTGLRFKPRMDVKLISPIVLVSAKRPMPTTAATGLLQSLPVRQTQPALILPTVHPKSNLGPVNQAM